MSGCGRPVPMGAKPYIRCGERGIFCPDGCIPWDDCKVAFGITDDKKFEQVEPQLRLPVGWSVDEIDCSGARCVVVFRVEGMLSAVDGQAVEQQLQTLKVRA